MSNSLPEPNWPNSLSNTVLHGWAGELYYPNNTHFEHHFQLYRDMVEFIMSTVKNPHNNVLWNKMGDCIYIKFRKKKDMAWFTLRFGA
jgi:hypothetical protein